MAECKFCGAEVEVGQICEYCGRKAEAWYYTDDTTLVATKKQESITPERMELPGVQSEKFCRDLGELIAKTASEYPIERGNEKNIEEAVLNAILGTYKIDVPETVEIAALYRTADDRVYPILAVAVRFSRWINSIEYEFD